MMMFDQFRFRESVLSKLLSVQMISMVLLGVTLTLTSCSSKKSVNRSPRVKKEAKRHASNEVAVNALEFKGVPYKYGGTTRRGMDCSGLIFIAHQQAGEKVPRTSKSLFDASKRIKLKNVVSGDLLFFATSKNKKRVNHVGLVTEVTPGEILFIHSTTSRGVIVSSLNEPYWLQAFLSAGRLP